MFLKILQNSQQSTCVGVSFLIKFNKLYLKRRLQDKCFLVSAAKFLRTPFFIDHIRWLFLNITILIVNATTTSKSNTTATPKHNSDDMETHINTARKVSKYGPEKAPYLDTFHVVKSLEDKLLIKIVAFKSHLFNDFFDLRIDITLLIENNEKGKQADSNNEKKEALLLKEKLKFLESKNSFLKIDITIKQKVIDSILKYNSLSLNHECCRVSQNTNNEIHQKSRENKEIRNEINEIS